MFKKWRARETDSHDQKKSQHPARKEKTALGLDAAKMQLEVHIQLRSNLDYPNQGPT